jgi:hypothetical protein
MNPLCLEFTAPWPKCLAQEYIMSLPHHLVPYRLSQWNLIQVLRKEASVLEYWLLALSLEVGSETCHTFDQRVRNEAPHNALPRKYQVQQAALAPQEDSHWIVTKPDTCERYCLATQSAA